MQHAYAFALFRFHLTAYVTGNEQVLHITLFGQKFGDILFFLTLNPRFSNPMCFARKTAVCKQKVLALATGENQLNQ